MRFLFEFSVANLASDFRAAAYSGGLWTCFLMDETAYILDITCLEIVTSLSLSKYGDSVMKISLEILITNGFENVKTVKTTDKITSVVFSYNSKKIIAMNKRK
tara:strand:+ start:261 stop:569 length:309 start_codon:yes stop_codon:yes gene_type:complete